ncbi:helix-turn-helix domain-containing protein [Psittacicella gerlachiana]|uniref:Cytoskeleton protein RodZ-like C-terminal domain-containing protein n=1 Tax=Psittacicella gerlachiana TaxID=2028574 RepID=A0A3A1YMB1_9GAMM|nr:RodZ domain-containing protein [Psittacicella gerlachiana]RIY38691.1 hypothetical protein CKF59_00455 [Psittacicella gerlachiana]
MTTLENKDLNTTQDNTILDDQNLSPENFGSYLKKKRHEKGESLEDVNKVIRVNPRVLKAFENNQFTNIEDFDNVYLRMYLKKYIEYLGLEDNSLIDKKIFEDTAKQVNRDAKVVKDSAVSTGTGFSRNSLNSEIYNRNSPSNARKILFLLITLVIILIIGVIVVKSVFNSNTTGITGTEGSSVSVVQNQEATSTTSDSEVLVPSTESTDTQNNQTTNQDTNTANTSETNNTESLEVTPPSNPDVVIASDGSEIPVKGIFIKLSSESWVGVKNSTGSSQWITKTVPLNELYDLGNVAEIRVGRVSAVTYLYINGELQDLSTRNNSNLKTFLVK